MATIEIERKFLVEGQGWKAASEGIEIRQGFLVAEKQRTVRVRIAAGKAFLTVKSAAQGITRQEFEYPIPIAQAEQILDLCIRPLIEKKRYRIDHQGMTWEVDEFLGENEGLVVAEIELESESQEFVRPDWLGQEVSHDPRYLNANLVKNPYQEWGKG
ncbi:MAG: CYTH domain-containing protein [Acidobacteriota bacterium]